MSKARIILDQMTESPFKLKLPQKLLNIIPTIVLCLHKKIPKPVRFIVILQMLSGSNDAEDFMTLQLICPYLKNYAFDSLERV